MDNLDQHHIGSLIFIWSCTFVRGLLSDDVFCISLCTNNIHALSTLHGFHGRNFYKL